MVGNLYFESIIEALYKKKYKLLLTISNREEVEMFSYVFSFSFLRGIVFIPLGFYA